MNPTSTHVAETAHDWWLRELGFLLDDKAFTDDEQRAMVDAAYVLAAQYIACARRTRDHDSVIVDSFEETAEALIAPITLVAQMSWVEIRGRALDRKTGLIGELVNVDAVIARANKVRQEVSDRITEFAG